MTKKLKKKRIKEAVYKDVGRPTHMTEPVLLKLCQAFAIGATDAEACLYADISPRVLYDYQKKHPEFLHKKRELKETPILRARQTIINNLDDKDIAWKYMQAKRADEFGIKHQHQFSGQIQVVNNTIPRPPGLEPPKFIEAIAIEAEEGTEQ